jgi:hypothetical protein
MQNVSELTTNEIELAKGFEVEELEERMEFGSWSSDVEVEPVVEGGGTYTPASGELDYEVTVGVAIKF